MPKSTVYTSEDYWSLPDGERAELIDGALYAMTFPNRRHQKIAFGIGHTLADYVDDHDGPCEVYVAPFAVNLDACDENWVEPDVLVVCDPGKLSDRGCEGAPDFIAEVVSPSSRNHDYRLKMVLYGDAGVREYWIVDPKAARTTVYRYETTGPMPLVYPFSVPVPVGVFEDGLEICIGDLG